MIRQKKEDRDITGPHIMQITQNGLLFTSEDGKMRYYDNDSDIMYNIESKPIPGGRQFTLSANFYIFIKPEE